MQEILEPSWEIYFDVLQFISNLVAFFWLLTNQGIIPAIAIFIISFIIIALMLINYPFFLQYIKRHLANIKSEQRLAFSALGVDIVILTKNMDEFISNKVSIHDLYTKKIIAAAKKS